MINLLIVLPIIGFIVSAYAFFIKQKVKNQPNYKTFCDLNDTFSCTKPMRSPYANLFYFSYAFLGMFYYTVILLLSFFGLTQLLFFTSILGMIGTFIFAYILYFKIKSICLLCTSLYIINILIFIIALKIH